MPTFDASLFEENKISPTISVDDAVSFFGNQGIFYSSDSNITKRVEELGIQALREAQSLREFKFGDPVRAVVFASHT
jgi:hypothetical protein